MSLAVQKTATGRPDEADTHCARPRVAGSGASEAAISRSRADK